MLKFQRGDTVKFTSKGADAFAIVREVDGEGQPTKVEGLAVNDADKFKRFAPNGEIVDVEAEPMEFADIEVMPGKGVKMQRDFAAVMTKAVDGNLKICITKQVQDRDGEVVMVSGGDLANYRKNPIMAWGHRALYGGPEDIMGKLNDINTERDTDAIPMITGFPQFARHQKAQDVKDMVEDDIIKTVSMGFMINDFDMETNTITAWELLEVSWVPIPSNIAAQVLSKSFKGADLSTEDKELGKWILNYKEIKPVIKEYRRLFMSDNVCVILGYEKTGDELVDMKNIHDLIVAKSAPKKAETQPTKSKHVTHRKMTKKDIQAIVATAINKADKYSKPKRV